MVQDIELEDLELEQIDGKSVLLEYMVGLGDMKDSQCDMKSRM